MSQSLMYTDGFKMSMVAPLADQREQNYHSELSKAEKYNDLQIGNG